MSTYTGTLPTALAMSFKAEHLLEIVNALHALNDAWTPYTPTWSTSGTAPSLGNGTITGSYARLGKLLICRGSLTWGSTTTGGTSGWQISTPVSVNTGGWAALLFLRDASNAAARQIGAGVPDGLSSAFLAYAGVGNVVTATAPFTWANGDGLNWNIVTELP